MGVGRVVAALVVLATLACGGQEAGQPDGAPDPDGGPVGDASPDGPVVPGSPCHVPLQHDGPWQLARTAAPNAITAVWSAADLLVLDGSGPLARLMWSGDEGRTWCQVPTPQVPGQVFREEEPDRLFLTSLDQASGGVRLFHSTDRGATWQRLELVLPREPSGVFRIGPPGPVLLVTFPAPDGSGQEVVLSLDDGVTFQARTVSVPGEPDAPLSWSSLRRDPRALGRLIAVVSFMRPDPGAPGSSLEMPALIATNDSGETWELVPVPGSDRLEDLILGPAGRVVSVSFEGAVSIQDPRPAEWRPTGTLPDLRARRLWANFPPADTFYLTGITREVPAARRLLKSTDAGATWSILLEPRADEAISPLGGGHFLGLSQSGLRVSRDEARSWTQALLQTANQKIVAAATGPRVHAVGHQSLLRSDDSGRTWSGGLLEDRRLRDIAPDPGSADGLYGILTAPGVAGAPFRLYRSQDAGASWSPIDLGSNLAEGDSVHAVVALATSPPSLLVSTDAGLFRSEDGGATWLRVRGGSPGFLRAAPSAPGTVLGMGDLLARSQDGGKTWTPVAFTNLPFDAEFHPTNADRVYLAAASGFRAMSLSEPGRQLGTNPAIPLEASGLLPPPRILAATASGGVHVVDRLGRLWHSRDEGVTWESPSAGTAGITFQSLAPDPTRPEALFLSTDSGLLRSRFE